GLTGRLPILRLLIFAGALAILRLRLLLLIFLLLVVLLLLIVLLLLVVWVWRFLLVVEERQHGPKLRIIGEFSQTLLDLGSGKVFVAKDVFLRAPIYVVRGGLRDKRERE
ncbi:MAG TPA: hypothetical protein VNW28_02465, partial [Chthoniobacterales bacterium]|nr:hypothetical protein [Chthoniobacterales bacterium]